MQLLHKCTLLILLITLLVVTLTAGTKFTPPKFNPLNKKHAVSRSSTHTSRGEHYDTNRAYHEQGQSHQRMAYKPYQFDLDVGQHIWEPAVYKQVTQLAQTSLGSSEYLPSIEDAANAVPEQIKMTVTARDGEMVVNWLTWSPTPAPVIMLGTQSGVYSWNVSAQSNAWVDPNSLHIVRYIQNALLTNLSPSTQYYYKVGDSSLNVFSDEMILTMVTDGSQIQTIAVFGDMGLVNSVSMQQLSNEVAANQIGMILHLGDYGYNMDELQGMTGDIFLEEMTNMTSAVPYMGCPGNHEQAFNFSHYANKFSMYNFISDPAGKPDQNWWYSWDFMSGGSRVHVITLDSELYYWDYFGATPEQSGNFKQMIAAQWNWIVSDLTAAYDSGKYDWIIAYSHRPMYCSNVDDIPDCTSDAETLRLGIPAGPNGELMYGFESALSVRPIDLYFSAHEHSYERIMPVFNGTIDTTQTDQHRYINPKYPVHIVTGAGGCREFFDFYDTVFYGPWSVTRSATYGYGHLIVHNSTHLYWEQLLDEGLGGLDTLWIIKNPRGEEVTHSNNQEQSTPLIATE